MSLPRPSTSGYTIYTKEKCNYCTKAKVLLPEDSLIVPCDAFVNVDRDDFLAQIDHFSAQTPRTFPMIFVDGVFIGGHDDAVKHLDEIAAFSQKL
jgi:glutaredoxin|tara:strand:- start:980 stop:1264 length:285 start_codon:yes stop_codon:yes gene_type:complete